MYVIHVAPTARFKAHSHRCDWTERTELNYLRTTNCQFSSVQCRQWEWAFGWAGSATNKTCRCPMLLMTLHIPPPTCSGRCGSSWRMDNCRQWGIWARGLVDQLKNANFTYPKCIWHFHWRWYHLNINSIFGIRKLMSLGYHVARVKS